MKITVKTIQQESIIIDIDEKETVLELKNRIFKLKEGEYSVEKQKLIYGGVILEDDKTIQSYEIDESNVVVLLLKRNLQTAEDRENVENKEPKKESENKDRTADEDSHHSATRSVSANHSDSGTDHPSLEVIGQSQNEDLIRLLMDMGFSRTNVEEALALNLNNPIRALEYLIASGDSLQSHDTNTVDSSLDVSAEDDSLVDASFLNEMSQEDREAIQRLHALGFPLIEVIQVYFACGKNEELAASILSTPDEENPL